ncbi:MULTISPECIES: ABC transporter permease [unclassified Pseudomonas]|uniref:ABC transporter permease n=1 Tax=unclassified Pseudomonas TaxID=196821 RepID=UPI000875FDC9|nr:MULTISPECIES: ABC transporter permease [unclassified Pseudomonas]SCZ25978.1 putative ABC transport system permease protein [Pseudomonas sp. NFACC44-2]SDA71331.1 putative ABC transport system permease protein [Pseudomonas sp. NFACC51]SEI78655.1 putative ABC transport system permease protein [Pseudomonas sp. NFACC07-1]SFH30653.1 putative ABC transport system permease protein [Pseudomonas sp. NFACC54]SFS94594.1 putative ABC transport system permease protein [Pseudomonas sp. NFACC48-1]
MIFRQTLKALLSHWRQHPVQFFSVLTGLWLATSLLTGVQALNSQARDSYARASQLIGGEPQASLSAPGGGTFPQQWFVELRRQGWPVSPVVQARVLLKDHEDQRLQLMGIDPVSLPPGAALAGQAREMTEVVAFFTDPGRTWIAPQTLQALGLTEGDRPRSVDGQTLPPLHAQEDMAPGVLLMDIGFAQQVLGLPEQLSRLLLPATFSAALSEAFTGRLQLKHADEENNLSRLTESFHLNLDALGFLSFVVGLFIVHAAIGLALEQRRSLLRTLRACGVSARVLVTSLTIELGALALLGGIAGVLSGYWLASLLLPDVAASLRGLYGAEVAGHLNLSPWWWFSGVGLSLLGALLAGADSLLRAARLPLLALANPQAWHQAHAQWLRRQGWVATVAALIAASALIWGDSLASGFVLMTALLLGAALALPVLLNSALKRLSRRSRSVLGQWFLADCRQQLPTLSLALMALLLALAANIGAGSMTAGFRQTFSNWLEQRLTAELYINPQTPAQADELHAWLTQQPAITAVVPLWQVSVPLQGWPTDIHGIIDHPHYRQHWPLLESAGDKPWEQLAAADTLMLSEQLARRLKVSTGDQLTLPTPQGPWALRIVGIYADYGNPKGHVLVNVDHLLAHWPNLTPNRFNLRIEPSAIPALLTALQDRFSLDDSRIVDQARLKGWSTQVFERTFAATAALNSLTLAVAGVALFISLLTQSQSRLAQLAPLWALGVTRRQLMLLNLGQTWLLALLTLVLALPLGIALAWCLDTVINVQAFGWRLPLRVFPLQLVQLLALAMLATLLASAWPLYALYRTQPADLLRTFAHED